MTNVDDCPTATVSILFLMSEHQSLMKTWDYMGVYSRDHSLFVVTRECRLPEGPALEVQFIDNPTAPKSLDKLKTHAYQFGESLAGSESFEFLMTASDNTLRIKLNQPTSGEGNRDT